MSEAVKKTYKHGFLYKIAVTFLTVIIIVLTVMERFLLKIIRKQFPMEIFLK